MIDPVSLHLWSWRLLYPLMCGLIIFIQLIPMQTVPTRFPAPDFLQALTFAWIIRRPDQIPVLSIALVFFLADILLQHAPGLGVALMILTSEFLRSRSPYMREFPFALEWAIVIVVTIALALGTRFSLQLLLLSPPPFDLAARQVFSTVLAYPMMVLFCQFILKVRFLYPGDREHGGAN
ncbi:rod shape-determining protein MreD [Halocynthiibacter sp.]|uniref:rod shape-determining protein MreD n=1 Tax=Halocynthiibacter sp. TaxID=1979210 RepID=UPI003C3C51D5